MADPVIADHFRAMAILKGKSGLPQDVYVNNFVFRSDVVTGDNADRIAQNLEAFYGDVLPPATSALKTYLPAALLAPGFEVRVYDLGQEAPREPTIIQVPMDWSTSSSVMPQEVAITASYYADRNLPRSRGRIYLGPLIHGSGSMESDGLRPADSVRANIAAACRWLSANQNGMTWCLLSRVDAQAKPITNGWVDDAFDTQRRRGLPATTRDVWVTA